MNPKARARTKAGLVPVIFLLASAFICYEALQVPVGTFRMPGPGFLPLGLGLTLGLLSLVLLGASTAGPAAATPVSPERSEVVYLIVSIAAAVALFEWLGFVPTMALFLVSTMRVLGTRSWIAVVTLALVGSVGAYLVFGRVLLIALPSGVMPF